jgi:hypothetical protein
VRRIETATQVADTMAKSPNVTYLPTAGGATSGSAAGGGLLINVHPK